MHGNGQHGQQAVELRWLAGDFGGELVDGFRLLPAAAVDSEDDGPPDGGQLVVGGARGARGRIRKMNAPSSSAKTIAKMIISRPCVAV